MKKADRLFGRIQATRPYWAQGDSPVSSHFSKIVDSTGKTVAYVSAEVGRDETGAYHYAAAVMMDGHICAPYWENTYPSTPRRNWDALAAFRHVVVAWYNDAHRDSRTSDEEREQVTDLFYADHYLVGDSAVFNGVPLHVGDIVEFVYRDEKWPEDCTNPFVHPDDHGKAHRRVACVFSVAPTVLNLFSNGLVDIALEGRPGDFKPSDVSGLRVVRSADDSIHHHAEEHKMPWARPGVRVKCLAGDGQPEVEGRLIAFHNWFIVLQMDDGPKWSGGCAHFRPL